jgi:methylglutaconyl-CoA hydratase
LVSAFLVLQVGEKQARDLLLSGRLFSSEEAEQMGLVTSIFHPEELAEQANLLAQRLKANSPQAMAATKRLIAKQNQAWLDTAIAYSMTANAEARTMQDFEEGISAFLEKRRPVWGR